MPALFVVCGSMRVPGTGLEPAQPLRSPDPKSGVSANFTNPAGSAPILQAGAMAMPRAGRTIERTSPGRQW